MSGDYLGISPADRAALTALARLVGEHRDAYVRQGGRWLFASREVVPLFPSDWTLTPPAEAAAR